MLKKPLPRWSSLKELKWRPVCSVSLCDFHSHHCWLFPPSSVPWRLQLLLAEVEQSIPPWCGAEPAPCCICHSQHPTLLLILPCLCYIHVLNILQMLLDVFLTHFLWSPCNLLCQNNCNLFKCQQATRGRWQLCARAEQLQGTGPILPLEQRSKLEERKRPFTSINHSLTPLVPRSLCSFVLLWGYHLVQELGYQTSSSFCLYSTQVSAQSGGI